MSIFENPIFFSNFVKCSISCNLADSDMLRFRNCRITLRLANSISGKYALALPSCSGTGNRLKTFET